MLVKSKKAVPCGQPFLILVGWLVVLEKVKFGEDWEAFTEARRGRIP